jgi:hypothetical protein
MSVLAPSSNATSSTFGWQLQPPPLAQSPSISYWIGYGDPPGYVPPSRPLNESLSQNVARAMTAPTRSSSRASYLPGSKIVLTPQQTYYRSASRAALVREFIGYGHHKEFGPATESLLNDFRREVKFVRGGNQDDWAAINRSFDRAVGFLRAISEARQQLRNAASASDPGLLPYIDEGVRLCTNAVREKLYNDKSYDVNWAKLPRLREKAHSARNAAAEKARIQAASRELLAQIAAFYANPSNDDITGVQPIQDVDSACLGAGKLTYGRRDHALRFGPRGTVIGGAGPNTPELAMQSVSQGGNRFPTTGQASRSGWLRSRMNYGLNAARAASLVQEITYAEDGEVRDVLLAAEHYSIDGGQTWPPNPYSTSPAIELAKFNHTNFLIERAKRRAGFYPCGAFFRIPAPPT